MDDADKPRIREYFESIPKQLAKENKKSQYSIVKKGGRASQYIGSIQWLEGECISLKSRQRPVRQQPLRHRIQFVLEILWGYISIL